ncbi:MAG: hypothetical protein HY542_02875 [Deltaproteobacteria bacterium]|nr:hypothetical protein [Deltaproteobacteria bacterium]
MERQELVLLMEAGYVYMGMGRFDEARDVFEGISVLSPSSEIPFVALGTVFFATKQFDRAIVHYKKALQLRGESPFARAYLGEALLFKGKKTDGIKELEKASLLDPSGTAGEFARSLMEAVKNGFVPPKTAHA